MSQYLSFYLRKKDNPAIYVDMGYFCTTPARQIDSLGAFPYTQEEKLLSTEQYDNYLSLLIQSKEELQNDKQTRISEINDIKESIYKCTSVEVAKSFKEELNDLQSSLHWYDEELEESNAIINKIRAIYDIWQENTKDWDLYYSNC